MARYEHLPIWRSAMDVASGLEQAVAGFPRVHRNALGSELRRSAQGILGAVMRCARARAQREVELERLVLLVQQLMVQCTLAAQRQVAVVRGAPGPACRSPSHPRWMPAGAPP